MAYRCFISHTQADVGLVKAFTKRASALDIEVYTYEGDVQAGQDLPAKLLTAIKQSDCLVALLTVDAVKRPAVSMEVGAALSANKLVMALIGPGVDVPSLTFLQGKEYIPLDPSHPTRALRALEASILRHRIAQQRAGMGALLAIGGLLLLLGAGD